MPRLTGKIALVTGAASGIGKAVAELFAAEGAHVWVTDLDSHAAEAAAHAIGATGGQTTSAKLDVTAEADWEQTVEPLAGRLDILVANAGVSYARPIADTSLEEWRRVMAINLDGVFLGVKHAIRAMRHDRHGGSIVIVSSASGIKAAAGASAYCSSKAALRLLSKCAALECIENGDNIRVNSVHPAGVTTPMWKSMPFFQGLVKQHDGDENAAWQALGALPDRSPLKRFSRPEEVARAILFLASDESPTMTGTELVIDSGFTA